MKRWKETAEVFARIARLPESGAFPPGGAALRITVAGAIYVG